MDDEVHVFDDDPLRPHHFVRRPTAGGRAFIDPNIRPVPDNAKWARMIKMVADQLPPKEN